MGKRIVVCTSLVATLIAIALAIVAWRTPAAPTAIETPNVLPSDWTLVNEFPAVPDPDGGSPAPAERLALQVERGWLVVRREASDGLQWSIVLARATDPNPPVVEVDWKSRAIDVRYGPYFIREDSGRLRVNRQKKTSDTQDWPVAEAESDETPFGSAWNVRLSKARDWYWVTAGAVADRPDVRIRFQHAELRDAGHGFQGFRRGLAYVFCGDEAKCFDEGDLLTARRLPSDEAEAVLRYRKLKAEFGTKPAPSLDGKEWFNSQTPLNLDQCKGKVVLLDFWGKWCGPCVAKLPAVQALHEKYKDRGLVVIGVHSADRHEGLAEFITQRGVSFPVLIDSEKTAARYLVGAWPTYFLIDKSGRVVSGFTSQPPTAERIEAFLAESISVHR